jgi:hypothetical protein
MHWEALVNIKTNSGTIEKGNIFEVKSINCTNRYTRSVVIKENINECFYEFCIDFDIFKQFFYPITE